jgi:hypothetical protein
VCAYMTQGTTITNHPILAIAEAIVDLVRNNDYGFQHFQLPALRVATEILKSEYSEKVPVVFPGLTLLQKASDGQAHMPEVMDHLESFLQNPPEYSSLKRTLEEESGTSSESLPPVPGPAETSFPEWFVRLSPEAQTAVIYEMDGVRHPRKYRNQGYGPLPSSAVE